MIGERSNVPCNGCTACCRGDTIMLHPELGDDPGTFLTEPAHNPLTGKAGLMLQHKPNGECVYLGEGGCTIHERAPVICREYDCRMQFAGLSRQQRRWLVKRGMFSQATMQAGRKRAHTLTPAEREEARKIGEGSAVNAIVGR